jgi:O-antigen ligase
MKTANSLASLVVPFATLLLFIQLSVRRREHILALVVGIAFAGAILGILQQLANPSSPLFFYAITNNGQAVGLFANRNHHAVFLCCALLIALYLAHSWRHTAQANRLVLLFVAAASIFIAILANASRAGLICLATTLIIAAIALLAGPRLGRSQRARALSWVALPCLLVPALAMFGLFAAADRSPALARLLGDSQLEEYRARILPHLVEMASLYQPWGTGFGSFEYAFRMREPIELLQPAYLNNAHNDWAQWVIEGGIGAIAIGLGLLAVIVWRLLLLVRAGHKDSAGRLHPGWLGAAVLVVLAIASLVDYPLRVPSIMALATISLALLVNPVLAQNQTKACQPDERL